MPKKSRDPVAYAHAIADRLAGTKTPAALKSPLATFRAAVAAFDAQAKIAEAARAARDAALEAVALADDILDPNVDALATEMVGTGMTKRARAFLGYSTYSPSVLQDLAYAIEVKEVEKLVAAVLKKKPKPSVVKVTALVTKNAKAVSAALAAAVKPEAAYAKALLAREAQVPALLKATSKLKKHAALAWEDDEPATYKSVFAPPDAVQAPKSPTAKKAAKTKAKKTSKAAPTTGSGAAPTTGSGPATTTSGATPTGSEPPTGGEPGGGQDPEQP